MNSYKKTKMACFPHYIIKHEVGEFKSQIWKRESLKSNLTHLTSE